ncbi:c-type cytochrome [Sulfurimonas paralvinellae]|uniref:C-type cytochrome n=1 Tax=Sulfurimonas paralvinellae TaxID=317658 RepID=A0A7M1B551_9BACT|nr:c-type cytochrome [Sulfurimonas paralvinellae]QOP44790.1 c-type cytochrome [Sulfurimonas paralvinellae]
MKKLLLVLILGFASLQANSGEEVYKAKCVSCHVMKGMMDETQMKAMRQKMQNASKEEKMAMRQMMMQKMQKSGMKAPPMPMVSKRLKMMLKSRAEFITFVEDYIQNPSKEKGFCMPMAYKRFGTMPPIGKSLSKEERTAVASWLYDNFKGSWGGSMDGKMCEIKNKNMKCGAGKCGAKKGSMKCGAVKIQTH